MYETAFQNRSTNIMKCSNTCSHENVLQFFKMHIVVIRENMFV